MGHKLKITGWVALGVVAGALTTVSLQTVARNSLAPLPLEEQGTEGSCFRAVRMGGSKRRTLLVNRQQN